MEAARPPGEADHANEPVSRQSAKKTVSPTARGECHATLSGACAVLRDLVMDTLLKVGRDSSSFPRLGVGRNGKESQAKELTPVNSLCTKKIACPLDCGRGTYIARLTVSNICTIDVLPGAKAP